MRKRKQQRKKIWEMNKIAARCFHKNLYAPEGKRRLNTSGGRGIDDRIIKTFGMGFAKDGWDHLMKLLAEKGYRSRTCKPRA